jgi:hypothetical protein
MSFNAPDVMQRGADALKELFLKKKEAEYIPFAEHHAALQQAEHRFHWFESNLQDRQAFKTKFIANVEFAKTARFADSILAGAHAHPAGVAGVQLVAAEFAGAFVLKQCADEIIASAVKEVGDFEAEFAAFKKDNAALLRELGLF